jgi:hypothetical protein
VNDDHSSHKDHDSRDEAAGHRGSSEVAPAIPVSREPLSALSSDEYVPLRRPTDDSLKETANHPGTSAPAPMIKVAARPQTGVPPPPGKG